MSSKSEFATYKRLKYEYDSQILMHKKMIQAQINFYQNSKRIEEQRHNEAMMQLDQEQSKRVLSIKKLESEFHQKINEIRSKYAMEKKKIERRHQHEMRMIEDTKYPSRKNDDLLERENLFPDTVYAESVVTELLDLYTADFGPIDNELTSAKNKKLKELSRALDAHARLMHSVINQIAY